MDKLTGDKAEIAESIAEACRILGIMDVTHGSLGHVSYREPGADTILIKGKGPSEAWLRHCTADDVLEVNFDAEQVAGAPGLQPPAESFIHIWLYKKNPEVRSVIHVHPEHAVLLTMAKREIVPAYGAYDPAGAQMAIEGVPVYPRAITVTDDELGEEFADFMGSHKVAMMRGHGISAVGSGIEDATLRCLTFNRLVTMTYKAYLIGEPDPIDDRDIAVIARPHSGPKLRGSVGGEQGRLASYRSYRRYASERIGELDGPD